MNQMLRENIQSIHMVTAEWGAGRDIERGAEKSICWFTPQQCSISAIDILGLVLRALCEVETGTVLDRNNPKVNLPHGSLNRVQYKTEREKRNLQTLKLKSSSFSSILKENIFIFCSESLEQSLCQMKTHMKKL